MLKIFTVFDWDSCEIVGVFTDRQQAEQCESENYSQRQIEEWEVPSRVFPQASIETLAEIPMDFHDDNGPGDVQCPICGASIKMKWENGKRVDRPEDLQHLPDCPVAIAKAYEYPKEFVIDEIDGKHFVWSTKHAEGAAILMLQNPPPNPPPSTPTPKKTRAARQL